MKTKEKRPETLFRRIGAIFIAMCIMSISFMTSALATTYAQTVTFTNMKSGDSIKAYRLISYSSASYNDYVFNGTFATYINQKKGDKTATAYFTSLTNSEVGKLVSEYAAEAQTVESEYAPIANDAGDLNATAGEGGTASLTLEPGYYMVLGETTKENSVIYSPTCVFVKPEGSSVKVYAGADGTELAETHQVGMKQEEAPTLLKQSKNPDHENETWSDSITSEVGDTVDFRIKVTIPAFSDGTRLNLTVKDTMTNMTFVTGSVAVYSDESLSTKIEGAAPESGIKVDAYNTETHTQDLSIGLDFDAVHPTSNVESTVYVFYQAKIHEDSSVNNVDAENVAKLVYSNKATPNVSFDTEDSKTDVDLYEIKLYKTDEDGNELAGAGFTVYEGTSTTPIKFAQRGNEYYPDDSGTVTEVPCDDNGYLHIVGLDLGTYTIKETKVPTGYYAPNDAFTLKLVKGSGKNTLDATSSFTAVNSADAALINTGTGVVEDTSTSKTNNIYEIHLKNSLTPSLPTAGGMGTILFTLVGIAIMIGASIIIFESRRNMNDR
jgi:fimbrial isopeptide formation D2 family protein